MTYVLKWTNPSSPNAPITIADGTKKDPLFGGTTSLTLTGLGFLNWGLPLQQNLLYLLENFASPSSPDSIALSAFTIGQTWFNSDSYHNRLSVNVGPTSSTWRELAWRDITIIEPQYLAGDLHFSTNKILQIHDGSTLHPLAYAPYYDATATMPTPNTYVMSLTPAITTYPNNFVASFKVPTTNTGPATINAGAGPLNLYTNGQFPSESGPTLLSAGDLVAGAIVTFLYTGGEAYITSVTQSQLETYGGNSAQQFKVAVASNINDAVPLQQAQSLLGTVAAVPVGTIIDFAGTVAPAGYLQCPTTLGGIDQLFSTTAYPTLFSVLGYTWGGSGATFGIPAFPADYAAIQAAHSYNIGTQWNGELLAHSHTYNTKTSVAVQSGSSTPCWTGSTFINTSSVGGIANYAAGVRVMKCIKY